MKLKIHANKLMILHSQFQELLVVDWYKDDRTISIVKSAISDSLDADQPTFYDKDVLSAKQI